MGVAPRRSDPVLLAGAVGFAIATVELLSWSVVAGGVGVVLVVVGARLLGRLPARERGLVLFAVMAAGAVALAVLATQSGDVARIAARALGAGCFAYAARALWRAR